uniref:Secreted protein n=1 Tax=Caenorhabditis japonica TaxID=281687 RepID=A0A8R1EKR2_CAEJA
MYSFVMISVLVYCFPEGKASAPHGTQLQFSLYLSTRAGTHSFETVPTMLPEDPQPNTGSIAPSSPPLPIRVSD